MAYKIADNQRGGYYFADGEIFKTKKDVAEQLMDYHDIDFKGTDENDNELSIEEFLKHHKIDSLEDKLNWVLEYGDWTLEEI